ncbi:MAG: MmcQ/YjbR family DNA-binding protein [Pseudonocardiaceae bacterium]
MGKYSDSPPELVAELRRLCLALPEAREEHAWEGTRWSIRKRTFAHVLRVEEDWPPVYARSVRADGPADVLTFWSSGPELDALANAGHPFFKPPWSPQVIGMVLGDGVDWGEVAELLTESYCVRAPKKLAALIERPV